MPDNEMRQMRDPVAIQQEIERAREDITRSVLALRERVTLATDWREWVRRRPGITVAAAFGIGFWIGYRSGR